MARRRENILALFICHRSTMKVATKNRKQSNSLIGPLLHDYSIFSVISHEDQAQSQACDRQKLTLKIANEMNRESWWIIWNHKFWSIIKLLNGIYELFGFRFLIVGDRNHRQISIFLFLSSRLIIRSQEFYETLMWSPLESWISNSYALVVAFCLKCIIYQMTKEK